MPSPHSISGGSPLQRGPPASALLRVQPLRLQSISVVAGCFPQCKGPGFRQRTAGTPFPPSSLCWTTAVASGSFDNGMLTLSSPLSHLLFSIRHFC